MHPTFSRMLPYLNMAIGSTALGFQITVLYPWHCQLDKDFVEMKKEVEVKLADYHRMKLERLDNIQKLLEEEKTHSVVSSARRSVIVGRLAERFNILEQASK